MIAHLKGLKVADALKLPAIRISHDADGVITRVYAIVPPAVLKDDVIDPSFLDNFEKALSSYELQGQAVVSQWTYEDRVYTAISVNA